MVKILERRNKHCLLRLLFWLFAVVVRVRLDKIKTQYVRIARCIERQRRYFYRSFLVNNNQIYLVCVLACTAVNQCE